jgi:hypothetical protein
MNKHLGCLVLLCVCLLAGTFTDKTLAQPSPSHTETKKPAPKPVIGQGVKHNLLSVAKVMQEIHQLMFQGQFTPDQDTEVSTMMIQLGKMMQEMSGPQREKLAQQHEKELQEIHRHIEIIKQQLKKSK